MLKQVTEDLDNECSLVVLWRGPGKPALRAYEAFPTICTMRPNAYTDFF